MLIYRGEMMRSMKSMAEILDFFFKLRQVLNKGGK